MSDVQEADVLGVALDETAPGLDVLAHQHREDLVRRGRIVDRDLLERAGLGVHRRLPQLLRVHLTETLIALHAAVLGNTTAASEPLRHQHVANLLALQPGEEIAQILDIRDYEAATYLVLATRGGLVKKTRLTEFDTNRQGGVIAIKLRGFGGEDADDENGDEVVSALLVNDGDEILLVSRQGMSLRFAATDESLRPMGRSTEGVKGMAFREGDSLLTASVATDDGYVFVVTEGGYAKRTSISEYRTQGRGGLGIKVAKLNEDRGHLAGSLIVGEDDEVLVVLASGKVVRSAVAEVPAKGRDTMGVVFARPDDDDRILAIARNGERGLAEASVDDAAVTLAEAEPTTPISPEESNQDE